MRTEGQDNVSGLGGKEVVWVEAISSDRTECDTKQRDRGPFSLSAALATGAGVSRESSGNRSESLHGCGSGTLCSHDPSP